MAISHFGSMTGLSGSNPGSGTWTLPTAPGGGWTDQYLGIFWLYARSSVWEFTEPTGIGITTKMNHAAGAGFGRLYVGYRYLQSGDTTFAWTRSVTSTGTDGIWSVDVVDLGATGGSGDPFNASSGATSTTITNSDSADPPAVTPASNDNYIWTIHGKNNDYTSAPTPPTNYTLGSHKASTAGNDAGAGTAYRVLSGGGGASENPGTWTLPSATTADDGVAWTASIAPVAAGGGVTPLTADITVTLTPDLTKRVNKVTAITTTLSVAYQRRLNKIVALGTTVSVAYQRRLNYVRSITVTLTATATRAAMYARAAAITITFAVAHSRAAMYARAAAVTVTMTVAATRRLSRLIVVSATFTVGSAKRVNKVVALTTVLGVSAAKRVNRVVALAINLSVAASRRINKVISAAVTITAAYARSTVYNRAISVPVTFAVVASRASFYGRTAAITITLAVASSRRISKAFAMPVTFAVDGLRLIPRGIAIVITTVADAVWELVGGVPPSEFDYDIEEGAEITFDVAVETTVNYSTTELSENWNEETRALPPAPSVEKTDV